MSRREVISCLLGTAVIADYFKLLDKSGLRDFELLEVLGIGSAQAKMEFPDPQGGGNAPTALHSGRISLTVPPGWRESARSTSMYKVHLDDARPLPRTEAERLVSLRGEDFKRETDHPLSRRFEIEGVGTAAYFRYSVESYSVQQGLVVITPAGLRMQLLVSPTREDVARDIVRQVAAGYRVNAPREAIAGCGIL